MNDFIKYRPDIDGLRAVAIISIFIYHLNPDLLSNGFLGVDIFFVISGYLISRIIHRQTINNSFSFTEFYARRIKRIFPALFVMLSLVGIFAVLSLPPFYYLPFFRSFYYAAGQVSNFYFSQNFEYFNTEDSLQPLLHTWSLAVEEQFYLVWATCCFLCLKKGRRVFIPFLIISFLASLIMYHQLSITDSKKAFYMFYCRAWEFCIGAIVSVITLKNNLQIRQHNILSIAGVSLMLWALAATERNIYANAAACIGAGLVILTGNCRSGMVYNILSNKILVFIGLISYSLYLWHWPVISFYKFLSGSENVQAYISITVISLIISVISYYFVEQRTRYSRNLSNKDSIAAGVICLVIFVIAGMALLKVTESGWRIVEKKKSPMVAEHDKELLEVSENNRVVNVVVIGDSHAKHYFPAVNKLVDEAGGKTELIAINGCPPYINDDKYNEIIDSSFSDRCKANKKGIVDAIGNKDITVAFIAMREENYTQNDQQKNIFKKEVAGLVTALREHNKKVYILGQVPVHRYDPHRCNEQTIFNRLFPRLHEKCGLVDTEYNKKELGFADEFYLELANHKDVNYFNPQPYFNSVFDEGGILLYTDKNHLNISGARYIYKYLKQQLTDMQLRQNGGSDQPE